jgi:integrase/recombinase XerD
MLATSIRESPHTRSPIVMPGYRKGQHPDNYGLRLPPEPLTRDEIERLLKVMGRGPCGDRNRALVVLMWRSGLRVSEALALYPKDIDRIGGTVTVLRGKGARRRQVAIDDYTIARLDRWMAVRAKLGLTDRKPLFCCVDVRTRGKPMYSSYVRMMLKQRGELAGIGGGNYRDGTRWGKRVHPHGLRHTMAFELLQEKADVGTIRAQLGHSQLATTFRYCDHLAPMAAIQAMHKRPLPEFEEED